MELMGAVGMLTAIALYHLECYLSGNWLSMEKMGLRRSLLERLVKTGGRLVKHARYYWLLLAEGHLSRRRFGSMLRRIATLPLPDA